jgi:hypothetical protein
MFNDGSLPRLNPAGESLGPKVFWTKIGPLDGPIVLTFQESFFPKAALGADQKRQTARVRHRRLNLVPGSREAHVGESLLITQFGALRTGRKHVPREGHDSDTIALFNYLANRS